MQVACALRDTLVLIRIKPRWFLCLLFTLDIFGKSVNRRMWTREAKIRIIGHDVSFLCVCFPAHRFKPRPKITLTHNKTKEHIDGRIHMCELYLSSVCCFGLLNHASATWFFYLYICAHCFGLLNYASSTRFFYLYLCAWWYFPPPCWKSWKPRGILYQGNSFFKWHMIYSYIRYYSVRDTPKNIRQWVCFI